MKSATGKFAISSFSRAQLLVAISTFVLLVSATASAQTETVLYSFTGLADGKNPYDGVVLDSEGNLYGTTYEGGDECYFLPDSCGVVFKVTQSGTETVVHPFVGSGSPGLHDGDWPLAGLVRDKKGNFYGTTYNGGSSNAGTVFKVGPTGTETVLYNFSGKTDGANPRAGLILDSENNLYGTTFYGGIQTGCGGLGQYVCGTVFKVTPAGEETVLYSFLGGADGSLPFGGLVRDAQGNLYGTTSIGGIVNETYCTSGCGTIFKLSPTGIKTTLYSFTGGSDGDSPQSSLLLDAKGNLYGTATGGGTFGPDCGSGCGTVYKLTPAGTFTVLHTFAGGTDGGYPLAGLVRDAEGNFYGTTEGNEGADGTVYKITAAGSMTVLHTFTGAAGDGAYPWGGVVLDGEGNLYGATTWGGTYGLGTVFKVVP